MCLASSGGHVGEDTSQVIDTAERQEKGRDLSGIGGLQIVIKPW